MKLPINYNKASREKRRLAREAYIKRQEGLCCHCKQPLSGPPSSEVDNMSLDLDLFPPNFLHWPVHLHHNHDTGMTIGAVHAKCNGVLWQYYGE